IFSVASWPSLPSQFPTPGRPCWRRRAGDAPLLPSGDGCGSVTGVGRLGVALVADEATVESVALVERVVALPANCELAASELAACELAAQPWRRPRPRRRSGTGLAQDRHRLLVATRGNRFGDYANRCRWNRILRPIIP